MKNTTNKQSNKNVKLNIKEMNSLDLFFILKENRQKIINSKVDKIYDLEKDTIQIRLHNPIEKKINIIIKNQFFFFITKKEFNKPLKPSSFTMLLRKHLTNSHIEEISQLNSDRVIRIIFTNQTSNKKEKTQTQETIEKKSLIIELLPPGNIILCNLNQKQNENKKNTKEEINEQIIMPLKKLSFNTRQILPKKPYSFPFREDTFNLDYQSFEKIIKKSNKESIVKTIAIDLGFSGIYAEEIIIRTGIEKNKPPNQLKENETKKIYEIIQQILQEEPKGYIYTIQNRDSNYQEIDNNYQERDSNYQEIIFSPIELISLNNLSLKTQKNPNKKSNLNKFNLKKTCETFSHCIEDIYQENFSSLLIKKQDSTKKEKIKKIIDTQKQRLNELENQIKDYETKGNLIYENYTDINSILEKIKSLRKQGKKHDEIEKIIQKELDEKNYEKQSYIQSKSTENQNQKKIYKIKIQKDKNQVEIYLK